MSLFNAFFWVLNEDNYLLGNDMSSDFVLFLIKYAYPLSTINPVCFSLHEIQLIKTLKPHISYTL